MDTLSKEQKSILVAAATMSSLYFTLHLQSENELALERMMEKGVETHAFPDELLKELYESSKATLLEECSKDKFSHEVMLSYKSYLLRMRQWGPMSSGGIWKWRSANTHGK
jgi:TRAP-type mannitol/chloroaromatic compound transport system substrate-binding protein